MPTASTASTSRARPTTSYYKDVNGNGAQDGGDTAVNSANLIQEEGDYVLVITCTDKGDYVNQSVEVPFSIAADQAESTFALGMVTGQADGQPVIDTDGIVFSGVQRGDAFGRDTGKIAFTVDGQFTPMNGVKLYRGTNMTAGAEMKDTDVLYEGDYTALVTYGSGAKTAVVKFHVGAFDLSKATVTHPAVDKAPSTPSTPPPWPSPARATSLRRCSPSPTRATPRRLASARRAFTASALPSTPLRTTPTRTSLAPSRAARTSR